jgi:riboflavin synthase
MFTGIIEELGQILAVEPRAAGTRLRIGCRMVLSDATEGCSIAVNGVCLTAVSLQADSFSADLAPETLRASNLGDLEVGSHVNLERSVAAGARLSGHIVQGHVDATGEFLSLEDLGASNWWLRIRVPDEVERYAVYKGSIAIDGISLTVASLEGDVLSVTIIPHTFENTTLGRHKPGDRVIRVGVIVAKYVEKMLSRIEKPAGLTLERMKDMGY